MPATLRQIADDTGLDVSTISRILNRPERARASEETVERVRLVATRLGYTPHRGAQSLRKGKSGFAGLLLQDMRDAVLVEYIDALNERLRKHDMQVLPLSTGLWPEDELAALDMLPRRQVDAIIGLHYHQENYLHYRRLREAGHRLVFRVVDQPCDGIDLDCVGVDISEAYRQLVSHLAASGYRKIALVGGQIATALASKRFDAVFARSFVAAHRELGLTFEADRAVDCGTDAEDARDAVAAAFRASPGFADALLVQSSKLIPGVCRAVADLGLRVPQDVGIATITDHANCRLADPEITVWDLPTGEICDRLAELLVTCDPAGPEHRFASSARLIARRSTAGPDRVGL